MYETLRVSATGRVGITVPACSYFETRRRSAQHGQRGARAARAATGSLERTL